MYTPALLAAANGDVLNSVETKIDIEVMQAADNPERASRFHDTVLAVHDIIEKKLYREKNMNIESYFKSHWNISRAQAYRLYTCGAIVKELAQSFEVLPTRERYCRMLKKCTSSPEERRNLWAEILRVTDGIESRLSSNMIVATWDRMNGRVGGGGGGGGQQLVTNTNSSSTEDLAAPTADVSQDSGVESKQPSSGSFGPIRTSRAYDGRGSAIRATPYESESRPAFNGGSGNSGAALPSNYASPQPPFPFMGARLSMPGIGVTTPPEVQVTWHRSNSSGGYMDVHPATTSASMPRPLMAPMSTLGEQQQQHHQHPGMTRSLSRDQTVAAANSLSAMSSPTRSKSFADVSDASFNTNTTTATGSERSSRTSIGDLVHTASYRTNGSMFYYADVSKSSNALDLDTTRKFRQYSVSSSSNGSGGNSNSPVTIGATATPSSSDGSRISLNQMTSTMSHRSSSVSVELYANADYKFPGRRRSHDAVLFMERLSVDQQSSMPVTGSFSMATTTSVTTTGPTNKLDTHPEESPGAVRRQFSHHHNPGYSGSGSNNNYSGGDIYSNSDNAGGGFQRQSPSFFSAHPHDYDSLNRQQHQQQQPLQHQHQPPPPQLWPFNNATTPATVRPPSMPTTVFSGASSLPTNKSNLTSLSTESLSNKIGFLLNNP